MTRLPLAALTALTVASSAFAGETVTTSSKGSYPPPAPELCFADHEWQVDLFAAYAFTGSNQDRVIGDHAWGGGVGLNYFFHRNIGLGIEGTGFDTESDAVGYGALNIFARFPIDEACLAPYVYAGVGGVFNAEDLDVEDLPGGDTEENDDALWAGHVGIGVEYRFTPNVGIFVDGRFTVVDKHENNFATVRTGVRLAF
ncbi:MAG TPA: outer membrane beta-barrel protein [Chthoniobacteraceae bacterium]|jgi:opacity protein-like surface antigen|nr:outer membrane beta-barrel protein [Chthoniobacteraceae bacterium]